MSEQIEGLDKKDIQIVLLLYNDSRISLRTISREVDLSVSAVKSRIRNLVARGGIVEFCTFVNPGIFGYSKVYTFCHRTTDIDEETTDYFNQLGKTAYQIQKVGGVSWVEVLTKKENGQRAVEFPDDIKLMWVMEASWCGRHFSFDKLSTNDLLIIKQLVYKPRAGVGEIAQYARINPRTVRNRLEVLRSERALAFSILINPARLGVVEGLVNLKVRRGARRDSFAKIDNVLTSGLMFVRYIQRDQAIIRADFLGSSIFEIDSVQQALNSLEGVQGTEVYLNRRFRASQRWVFEETDKGLSEANPKV
ncbi:MAG: winged helix-turn-helix transcriptional regulator [Thaumarchaeota archaeon]|nr:winged helix-turn-helix transcriptional regulator [Nitrososphaerota archaeon]